VPWSETNQQTALSFKETQQQSTKQPSVLSMFFFFPIVALNQIQL